MLNCKFLNIRITLIVFIFITATNSNCLGQVKAPEIKWQKLMGGLYSERNASIISTSDSGFLVSVTSYHSNIPSKTKPFLGYGLQDYWVLKYDKKGVLQWEKSYGGASNDVIQDIVQVNANKYILVGNSNSSIFGNKTVNSYGEYDVWIVCIDSLGNILWQNSYGGIYDDGVLGETYGGFIGEVQPKTISLVLEQNGSVTIATSSESDSSGNKIVKSRDPWSDFDYWIFNLNSDNGQINWQKTIGGPSVDIPTSIVKTKDNGYIILGSSNSNMGLDKSSVNAGAFDVWFVKIDSNRNKIWDKTVKTNLYDVSNKVIATKNGKYVISSTVYTEKTYPGHSNYISGYGSLDIHILEIDENGNELRSKVFGSTNRERLNDIIELDPNKLLIGLNSPQVFQGQIDLTYYGGEDFWLVELDSNWYINWLKKYGGSKDEFYLKLAKSSKNEILFAGQTSSSHSFDVIDTSSSTSYWETDLWIARLAIPKKTIIGTVFSDYDSNCVYNRSSEWNLKNSMIKELSENKYYMTNDSGFKVFLFEKDTAILSVVNLDSNFYINCNKDTILLSLSGKKDSTYIVDFPLRSKVNGHCIHLNSLQHAIMRPGGWNLNLITYQNRGFEAAQSAYIEIEIDTAKIDSVISKSSFIKTGNRLRFNIGNVGPFANGSFFYSIRLKTNVKIGSVICQRAYVFPICNMLKYSLYDSSKINVKLNCNSTKDSINVQVLNSGDKGQSRYGKILSYEDEILIKSDSFKLSSGEVKNFVYKIEKNKLYTTEVFNNNFDPINPVLIRQEDICLSDKPFIANNPALGFNRRDESKQYEEDCDIIRGSYDPNIKSVQPSGMYDKRYTSKNTELKYRIDFQNTGNDTAFKILIIDTLSNNLDIESFLPGASSHPYSVEINGRALKFSFDPIALADSNVNEQASHGFVSFKIKHKKDIPLKARIENKVDIYFDYNEPIRTNVVFNTIYDTISIAINKNIVDTFQVSPDSLFIPSFANSIGKIDIKSNKTWTATSSELWLTLSTYSGVGNEKITLTALANTAGSRSAIVKITTVGLPSFFVKVIQSDSITKFLFVSKDTIFVNSSQSSNYNFLINSNVSWTITNSSNWVKTSTNSGTNSKSIFLAIDANPNFIKRVANLNIQSSNMNAKKLTIVQIEKPYGADIKNSIKEDFDIYPIPTTNILFIQFNEPVKDLLIELVNLNGSVVKNYTLNGHSIEIQTNILPKGIYHLRCINSKNQLISIKKVHLM
jgi:uncharacterized repeat protein (TIGR01451 family)